MQRELIWARRGGGRVAAGVDDEDEEVAGAVVGCRRVRVGRAFWNWL